MNANEPPGPVPPVSTIRPPVSGEVDLETVPRERVIPEHDIAVTARADVDIAGAAQHPARLGHENAHVVLVGVKVEIPDRPGGRIPMTKAPLYML